MKGMKSREEIMDMKRRNEEEDLEGRNHVCVCVCVCVRSKYCVPKPVFRNGKVSPNKPFNLTVNKKHVCTSARPTNEEVDERRVSACEEGGEVSAAAAAPSPDPKQTRAKATE